MTINNNDYKCALYRKCGLNGCSLQEQAAVTGQYFAVFYNS